MTVSMDCHDHKTERYASRRPIRNGLQIPKLHRHATGETVQDWAGVTKKSPLKCQTSNRAPEEESGSLGTNKSSAAPSLDMTDVISDWVSTMKPVNFQSMETILEENEQDGNKRARD